MRLTAGTRPEDVSEIREFVESILKVGDEELEEGNDAEVSIDVPGEILIAVDEPVTSIIDFTYLNLLDNINDPSYFQEKERRILEFIIWDEAPMANKLCFEALDRSLRDIIRKNRYATCEQPFGNMTMVFGGDFRQVLSVIPKAGDDELGEPNDIEVSIDLPEEILIDAAEDPVMSIIDFTYPNILDNINDLLYFQEKAILATTNGVVDNINEHLLEKFSGEEMVYLSCDIVYKTKRNAAIDQSIFSPEFIN
nr:ATP-dependent DNA helicase PIF1-like [Tanacetum cinerariifolium]